MNADGLIDTMAAVVVALAAAFGVVQYFRGERWNREEFVAGLIKEFEAEPLVQRALTALDWSARKIDLFPERRLPREKWTRVDDVLLREGLRAANEGPFSDGAARVRDAFDGLFSRLDRFDVFIERGLVSAEAFRPYLIYWIDMISSPASSGKSLEVHRAMWRFIDDYGYEGLQRLCRRYGYEIQPPVKLRAGDVFLTRGDSWLSRAIRFFTRSLGESRTRVNHVGVVVTDGWLRVSPKAIAEGWMDKEEKEAEVVEAVSSVRCQTLPKGYLRDGTAVAVFRPQESHEDLAKAVKEARSRIGERYGWLLIVGHFLDWCLLGVFAFRRLLASKDSPICSYLVAEAFEEIRASYFGKPPRMVSPDDLWDCLTATANAARFKRVRDLTPIEGAAVR